MNQDIIAVLMEADDDTELMLAADVLCNLRYPPQEVDDAVNYVLRVRNFGGESEEIH